MYKILEKTPLNPTVTKMVIEAPLVAKKAEPPRTASLFLNRVRSEESVQDP